MHGSTFGEVALTLSWPPNTRLEPTAPPFAALAPALRLKRKLGGLSEARGKGKSWVPLGRGSGPGHLAPFGVLGWGMSRPAVVAVSVRAQHAPD